MMKPEQKKLRVTCDSGGGRDAASSGDGADVLYMARKHFASRSALVDILKAVEKDGLPTHYSRNYQYTKRKQFGATATTCGRLVQTFPVGGVTIAVQSPAAMLRHCAHHCEGFKTLLQQTHTAHGDAPWSLILYTDGVSPQDTLSKNDQRKFTAIYWSFAEFWQCAFATKEVWFCLAVVRTTLLADIPGGLSQIASALLDEFWFNPSKGIDFGGTGILLPLRCGSIFALRCELRVVVSDEPALKELYDAKGHAGIRNCILCFNIVQSRYWNDARDAADNVRSTCRDFEKFKKHTDASIRAVLRTLAEARAAGHNINEMETRLGWNCCPGGFANHPRVNPFSITMFDWMHIYLVGGLLAQELGNTLANLRHIRVPIAVVTEFLSKWTWPKSIRSDFRRLFKKTGAQHATGFSSTASELLSLTPVLAMFFASLEPGCLAPQINSLVACFDVVEILASVKLGIVTGSILRAAINNHVQLRAAAYGDAWDAASFKPHGAQHLPDMLESFGFLLNCFVQERHHKLLTKYAWEQNNTQSYEESVVEHITIEQTSGLNEEWLKQGLIGGGSLPKRHTANALREFGFPPDTVVASSCKTSIAGRVCVDDVVAIRSEDDGASFCCGVVALLLANSGGTFVIVGKWRPLGSGGEHTLRYDTTDRGMTLHAASDVVVTLIFSRITNSEGLVKLPPQLRS